MENEKMHNIIANAGRWGLFSRYANFFKKFPKSNFVGFANPFSFPPVCENSPQKKDTGW